MNTLQLKDKDRIILLSDVHYGIKSGGDNTINYLSWMDTTDAYFREFLIPIIEDIKQENNPILIVCGDFFDNRISIRLDVMHRAYKVISELASHIDIIFIPGNHDCYHSEDSEINSLRLFDGIQHVRIVDTNTRVVTCDGKLKIDLFPWTSNKKKLSEDIKNSDADVVLIHADVNGLTYASNVKISNGVDVESFKGRKVYSGHIHKRQETNKVTYIGCPYEQDRSDTGNSKGVYVIGIDNECDGGFYESFFENFVSPRFITYTYDEFKDISRLSPDDIKNNYVEVTYRKENNADIAKMMNDSDKYGCASIIFRFIDDETHESSLTDEQKNMSIEDTVEEFINNMKDISNEQREFLLKKNRQYTEKVKNAN